MQMAQTLATALSVKQKALSDTRDPASQSVLRTFFSYISQHRGSPDLQFVAISGLNAADVVLSDVALKLYVVLLKKPTASTTDAWAKISDHASAAAANGDWVSKFIGTSGGGQELCAVWPAGMKLGTGATIGSHTTVNGSTKSASADAPVGFAIVGAA
jgi:hypothetical protein